MYEYENIKRVSYGNEETGHGIAIFIPICSQCGRFVKADKKIFVNDSTGLSDSFNATCSKHGRIKMIFEGFI